MYPHDVNLQLYQVHAVTEGTDAQATVSVKIEENGKTTVGQAADTDTLVASANAYLSALNKMIIKRSKIAPQEQEHKKRSKPTNMMQTPRPAKKRFASEVKNKNKRTSAEHSTQTPQLPIG